MQRVDFLIVGGGIAGLSAAAALSSHGTVAVLEAEDALGYHSSGRSATFSHYGIGNRAVRALTAWSRRAFENPAATGPAAPIARRASALFVATEDMVPALHALEADMAPFAKSLRRVGEAEIGRLFPPLRTGPGAVVAGCLDDDGLRLDSDAMLQACAKAVRSAGGEVLTGCRVASVRRCAEGWHAVVEDGRAWTAPLLINAAGAWADDVARLAGVPPLGLRALRRTIIVLDPPAGADVREWPFVKTALDDFYILPDSGRLIASPVDEVECAACDAQPEDYDIALAAWKVEQYTNLPVERIAHRWAGLRTFAADRVPAAGFDHDAPGFFWLVGQGGYGLQTAPSMAAVAEALVTRGAWPEGLAELGAGPAEIGVGRLIAR